MAESVEHKVLTKTLSDIEKETEGSRVTIGEIIESTNRKGFGALLIVPAILMILPTGAIPGFPALGALMIFSIAGQIIIGRKHPWIPKRIKNFSMRRQKLINMLDRTKPYTRRVDKFIKPRLEFFSSSAFAQKTVALTCIVLALLIALIGFIPLLPAILSMPILFFALGVSGRDGIMTILGFVFTVLAATLIFWLTGFWGGEERIHIPKFTPT